MSDSKTTNQGNPQGNPMFLLLLGVGFLAIKLYEKQAPKAVAFFHAHALQMMMAAVLIGLTIIGVVAVAIWNRLHDYQYEREITAKDASAVFLGRDDGGKEVYLKQAFRTSHTQVIGTTSAGKTKSIIFPSIIKDIENGSGMLIIDGKSDSSFLEELYANVVRAGREDDFRLFSLANIAPSSAFNPLEGGTPHEVVERVFSSFPFENEYYRNVQYKIFLAIVRLIHAQNERPTIRLVHRLLTDMETLRVWLQVTNDEDLKRMLTTFMEEPARERMEKVSGLDAYLSHFLAGDVSILFHAVNPEIQLEVALKKKLICYFQLPTMYYPFLAQATGKLVLQCFQSAVAKRHLGPTSRPAFFSCYLDDFQDYIYEGFSALLNKSRSANIGVVFSHQALGDLDKVSPAFRNIVLTNTNVKIVMRTNDPDTCEYFAKSFGTKTTEKVTERRLVSPFGETRTGEGSVREVEEFTYHPNIVRQLKTGEGIVAIPHPKGVKLTKIQFKMKEEIPAVPLPMVLKELSPIPVLAFAAPEESNIVK